MNPCCALLNTSHLGKRKALRQALKIQQEEIDRLQLENLNLKKACDEERTRANVFEKEKGEEASLRISMENEISVLKSETSFEREAVSGNEELNKEVTLLRTCLSERHVEIDGLKQLLTEQGRRADAEKDHAGTKRKRVAELQQELAYEKNKADEARKKTDALENEIVALKSEISTSGREVESETQPLNNEVARLRTCISERELEINRLQSLLNTEETKAGAERQHADLESKKTAELQEALAYEKCRADEARTVADDLGKKDEENRVQLETSKNEVDKMRLKCEEAKKKFEAERQKAISEKKRADLEKKTVVELQKALANEKCRAEETSKVANDLRKNDEENRVQLETLKNEVDKMRLKCEEAKKEFEAEKMKVVNEKKRADLERKTAVELQEALAYEKCRAEEASKVVDDLGKKEEENRVQLETLKNEVNTLRLKCEEAKEKLEAEKKVNKEKRRADEKKMRVIEQRRIADSNEKKVVEEKSHTTHLLIQLEEKEQNLNKLRKELQEAMSSQGSFPSVLDEVKGNLEAEMKTYAREKGAAEETSKREDGKKVAEASAKKAFEEKHFGDKVSQDLMSTRQRAEYLEKQLLEVESMLEAERKKALWQEKRAEAEKLKSDEQERIAAENRRLATVEKLRANNKCQELENSRKKLQDMENELHELKSLGKLGKASDIPPVVVNVQTSQVQFLQKQLKFEKQRVKHAKEVAELEKERNKMLQQELLRVSQGVECYFHQFDVLTNIGARNGANNVSKKSGLSDKHTGILSKTMLPSRLYPCGDAVVRMSSLSSRDASCQLKENGGLVPAGHHLESPSGMETELDVLVGGSPRETLRSSALNLNTASFTDEQLVGSQGRVMGSLTTSAVLAAEKSNMEAKTTVRTITENNVRSPVKTTVHATKRKEILDEVEYIKSTQSEGRRIFEEAEKKLSALHSRIVQPMVEQTEKKNCLMPICVINSSGDHDKSSKKRKASCEPEATCLHIVDSNVQPEVGKHVAALTISKKLGSSVVLHDQSNKKRKALHGPESTYLHIGDDSRVQAELRGYEIVPSASEGLENSVVLRDASKDIVLSNQDHTSFEELMNGDYMKLLNLDNAVDEECFRAAMDSPLPATIPEINFHDDQAGIDTQTLSVCTSNNHKAGDKNGGFMHGKIQLYCIVFSDMEGDSTVNRILSAIRTCLTQCSSSFDTNWMVHHILAALGLEKDLEPREKLCALFSLIVLNFSGVLSRKFENYQNKKLLDSFRAHINSVLSGVEKRVLFDEICHISDLVSLFEDFVMSRRIQIKDGGKKYAASPNVASIDLIMAASITVASICSAIGHVGSICEVSFNILRMCTTEDQMTLTLRILHMFSYLCGQEYVSNSCTSMKVVKSLIKFLENNTASISSTDSCFIPCGSCPFSENVCSLDDVSAMLLEELQNYCLGNSQFSITERVLCNLSDVLSSLELIASKMGWKWTYNKIVPKLLTMLESCGRERFSSTALVALLGELGRLGVKENEDVHDDAVEIIKCKLTECLCDVDSSQRSVFAMAVVSSLVRLHPKYDEEFVNISEKLSQNGTMSSCLSSLTFLFGLKKPTMVR